MAESPLSYFSTFTLRQDLLARNLPPYTVPGVYTGKNDRAAGDLYLTNYSTNMRDGADLNKPDYISNEFDIIYDFYTYFRIYSLWGNYSDLAESKSLYGNSYNVYKWRFKHLKESFDKCKCEVWTLIEDDAFEKNSRRYAENNAKVYQTDMIVDKGIFSDTYAETKFYDPNGKYNFSSSRFQFPVLYTEALAKICMEKLRKTLPPQG